jgi:diaminobutyrate-2-oxoglutarate transaminase
MSVRSNSALFSSFEEHESNVRSYCRCFPTVFTKASQARMTDVAGKSYIDLLSGAGTLNYGHNNQAIVGPVVEYLKGDGVVHSLDLHTEAKARFIDAFQNHILAPRGMSYKMQFTGPTGTNAIEAAMKLARKVTGRHQIIAFSGAYHGMTLGALAATTNASKRQGAGVQLDGVTFMPFDGFLPDGIDGIAVIEAMLLTQGTGIDAPAAILLETVQGEGGLNAASAGWLRRIEAVARSIGALLIIDDIQAGNGRTGPFFSFEGMGITPDMVVLSKSLSGFGAPLSILLMAPEFDCWSPGEHNGTFRGNNLAFVGATAAIETYWMDDNFQHGVAERASLVGQTLHKMVAMLPPGSARLKGRGLFTGLECLDADLPRRLSARLFERGVIIETCGHKDQVLKILPPLNIPLEDLNKALALLLEELANDLSAAPSATLAVTV